MASPQQSWISIAERLKLPTEQWNQFAWQLLCNLRVSGPAIVTSIAKLVSEGTIEVQLAIKENIIMPNDPSMPVATLVPILVDVPISVPQSSAFALTLPVAVGDEVLLVFGDNCFNAWWQNGGTQSQEDRRRHDLSDAFAILGIRSKPNILSNYSTTSAQLRSKNGTVMVEVTADSVNVTAPTAVNVTAPTVVIQGSSQIEIEGGTVSISGSTLSVSSSSVTFTNDITIDGRSFLAHEHTGGTISGNTGPVI